MSTSEEDFNQFAEDLDKQYQDTPKADAAGGEQATDTDKAAQAAADGAGDVATKPDGQEAKGGDGDGSSVKPDAKDTAGDDAGKKDTKDGDGTAGADGKKDERVVRLGVHVREVTAERKLREKAEAEVKELREQLGKVSDETKGQLDELEALKATLPEDAYESVEKAFRARDEKLDRAMKVIERYEQAEEQRQRDEAVTAQSEVDTALQANDTLSQWHEEVYGEDGEVRQDVSEEALERWNAVAAHDKILRASPAWSKKPLADRFQEAMTRAARDLDIELPKPETDSDKDKDPPPKKELPAIDPEKGGAPASLSNIPKGKSPSDTSQPAAENMSLASAIHATKNMDRDQAERLLLHGG